MQVFINEAIVILLRGEFPKAKMGMIDNQQYTKTGCNEGVAEMAGWRRWRDGGDGGDGWDEGNGGVGGVG